MAPRITKRAWDNGVSPEVRIALALVDGREPLTIGEISARSRIVPRLVRHHLDTMITREVVLRDGARPARYRLQPLLYRQDLLARLHRLLYNFVGEAQSLVEADPDDPLAFAHNWRLLLEILALDSVKTARDFDPRK